MEHEYMEHEYKGPIYRITIEAIGDESQQPKWLNAGAPLIVECDGFCVMSKLNTTDGIGFGADLMVHNMNSMNIAQILYDHDDTRCIGSAMQIVGHIRSAIGGKSHE